MFSCNFPFPWWGVVAERAGNEEGCFKKGWDKWGEERGILSQLGLERWRTNPKLPLSGQASDHAHLPHPAGGAGTHWAHRHCQLSLPSII